MRTLAAMLIVGVMSVSCGSGDEPSSTPPAVTDDGASKSIGELITALEDIGCPLEEVTPTEGYDISRQASCPDARLQVYTFTTKTARDQVVTGILGIAGEFAVVGPNWVAEARSRAMADSVKAKVGGTVREAKGGGADGEGSPDENTSAD